MFKNKKGFLLLLPIAALAFISYSYIAKSDKEEAIEHYLLQSLNTFHFSPQKVNDNFSEKVFKQYIQYIDFNKKFLIQEDIDALKQYEHTVDDDLNDGNFEFFEKSLDIINLRINQAEIYYKTILSTPFDFKINETVEQNAEKINFAKDTVELKEQWRKYLKLQVLSRVVDMKEDQDKAKEKSDTVKIKSLEVLEEDARKKVLKSTNDWFKRLKKLTRNDRLSSYFNAVTSVYDPHTEYYAPKDKANFDISMSGKLEGIGAQLQEKDGYIKVTNIVPGSASWRQGELKAGDIILKVAQGENEPVDITDMRLDDAVQLIRGKKGTEVRLTVKKPDGKMVVIPITRDIVVMEETFAKSVILKTKENIGYIKLPSFYADFNGTGGRNCSRDIKIEIQKLKDAHVDGIILDLRNNGGGSLNDVVDMAGLFIGKGPIVQVKSSAGAPYIMEDRDPAVFYNGPLVVMVNANSASASEIMAAAIQDYNRGVIVGTSSSTFGKGTVQRFYDLDGYLTKENNTLGPLGEVKITIQKFYRINGGATQLKGVIPDITLPDPYYLIEQGEKEQDYPMIWDEIPAASYQSLSQKFAIDRLKNKTQTRIKKNEVFETIHNVADKMKQRRDSTVVSLNIDTYIAAKKKLEAESKELEKLDKEITGIEILPLKSDKALIEGDTASIAKEKDWYKTMRKDVYLHETLSIIHDMQ
jgi:carboxyl-terminal processing protease